MLTSTDFYDVVVTGAGPTGLMLAGELRGAGCSVLVLERSLKPLSQLKEAPFGRRGLSVPSIEILDRRGHLDALRPQEALADTDGTALTRRPSGHFAGIDFFEDQVEAQAWPYRLPGAIAPVAVDMVSIEAVLTQHAEALGAVILRGCDVDRLTQSADGIDVHAGAETFSARWLVGCDGGRSAVRKLAGIGFTGTEPEFTGYCALVTLAAPEMLQPGRNLTESGIYIFQPPGTLWLADFDGGAGHRPGPIASAHVEAVLRRVSGVDVSVETLHLASCWTDRARLATAYADGRVLLAGDAAHIHSPLGGQGLNLGLGDAMNLGWKLAATIHGNAAPNLLASYERERRPIASEVLERSRAQVALLRPDPGSRALEAILRDLAETRDGATYFAERVRGIGMRYDLGEMNPLVGRSAPDFTLAGGIRLNERLRDRRGLLLDFEHHASLRDIVSGWSNHVGYAAGDTAETLGLAALLVRPDGIIAWAMPPGGAADSLRDALSRWFGAGMGPSFHDRGLK